MKSILDPTFRYYSSVDTDLRRTFERVRRELSLAVRKPVRTKRPARASIIPLRRANLVA